MLTLPNQEPVYDFSWEKHAKFRKGNAAMTEFKIKGRAIGDNHPPFVIAEIGINHEGSFDKAIQMIDDAVRVGAECVKFQCHIPSEEMIPNKVIPGNAKESIWDIISRCTLNEDQEIKLKKYTEEKGLIYMSTPFSRAAANRLEKMDVPAYKIGSGECNNYPLIDHVASFGKPIILSTGMNDLASIEKSVQVLRGRKIPFALLHCTSIYPTPYDKVRLHAMVELKETFPDAVVGLSDHTLSNYPCLGAVALGARILERHFTSDKSWPGPDINVSMDPIDLKNMIEGSRAIFQSLGGRKSILAEEQPTIDFAYSCVVALQDIGPGEQLNSQNIWVKRPGTGEIKAEHYSQLIGKVAKSFIAKDTQLQWQQIQQQ
jgi:N-acetylneuraminate synthase